MLGVNNDFIFVSIIVDENGDLDSVVLEKPINIELDKEVIKSLEKINLKWLPAIRGGKHVKSKIFICFNIYNDEELLNTVQGRLKSSPHTKHIFLYWQISFRK